MRASRLRLFLIEAPMFVIRTWQTAYTLVLAIGSLILWGVLMGWLALLAWEAVRH